MSINSDDLKYNFGCGSCGYKEVKESIPLQRIITKLDALESRNDILSAEKHLEYWRGESVRIGDYSGELSVCNELLGVYRKTLNPQKGTEIISRCFDLLDILQNRNSVSGATILLNAGTTLKAFGFPEKSLPIMEEAREIYERELASNDERIGGLYNNLALVYCDLMQYDKAEELYLNAISIMKNSQREYINCAVSYVNLAHLIYSKEPENEEKINSYLSNAESVLEINSLERNSYYAFVCSKCAPSFDFFGFFAYAAELKKRSEEIYARA